MNFAQRVDENGEHVAKRPTICGRRAAPVVVREFNPRTRRLELVYEGPFDLEHVMALGRKGSTMMKDHA